MNEPRISIERALDEYRVLHTPSNLSWKQHLVKDIYSHSNLLECDLNEKIRFFNRIKDSEILITNNVRTNVGNVYDLSKIVSLITDESRAKKSKSHREACFGTSLVDRPVGNAAFNVWNGFQMIDIDIHSDRAKELAPKMRDYIFEKLKDYNWFFLSAVSNSGTGVHIYTKIQISEGEDKRKIVYYSNYRHKYSFVYLVLKPFMEREGFNQKDLVDWMDQHMMKPQQACAITYDKDVKVSTKFFEDFIYVDFDNVDALDDKSIDWVTHPELREVFKKWTWFDKDEELRPDLEVIDSGVPMFDTKNKFHYKHNERWRLANTLVNIYGIDLGSKYMRNICSAEVSTKEIQGDCRTAATYKKDIDEWAVHRLNAYHGFKIKLNREQEIKPELYSDMINLENPLIIGGKQAIEFRLKADEYLGTIRHALIENIKNITLIEAGAGLGKTEMIKQLVRDGKKVMMVMPFTSTIKSKVEKDKDWAFSYANKKVNLDVRGLSLTVDKFSRLNPMDLKVAGFDYIFIDESHLLFMSEYRPVMSKVIELIRQLEIPVIFTTGTPVAESIFFPELQYIRVTKEETRKKDFSVYITNTNQDCLFAMCKSMAEDIKNGNKILFPTNAGTLYQNKIRVMLRHLLDDDDIIVNYYKKSNNGEDFMDDINFNKTVSNSTVLMCSSFLSVGVDINDRLPFVIYTNTLWMPQELEQFANRLRSNDLHIKMFLSNFTEEGESKRLMMFRKYDPQLNNDELKNMHSILKICNDMIERNPTEYKYNSLVTSIISQNKFIEFNEVNNKYYFNDIAYKVTFFERKYREYVQQLIVLYNAMRLYGYECFDIDTSFNEYHAETSEERFTEIIASVKHNRELSVSEQSELATELLDIMTEDRLRIYKSVMDGMYEIKKGNKWSEDLTNMIMYVKDIEVFEKVVPIFVSLSKIYSVNAIRGMFNYCIDKKGNYNWSDLRRLRKLAILLYNAKRDRIDLPILNIMNDIDEFVSSDKTKTKNDINMFIASQVIDFANKSSKGKLDITKSPITMENITKHFEGLFDILVEKKTSKKKVNKGEIILKKRTLLWKEHEEEEAEEDAQHRYIIEQFFPEFIDLANAKKSEVIDASLTSVSN